MTDLHSIPRKILKFGGTSLASADRMRQVAEIVRAATEYHAVTVVVSAMGGVTNQLVDATRAAAERDEGWREILTALHARHLEAASSLAKGAEFDALENGFAQHIGDLEDLLHGIFLLRECSPRTRDSVLSFGERLSAPLLAAGLRGAGLDARAVDARKLLVTDDTFGRATLRSEASHLAIRNYHLQIEAGAVPVVTGFIAATSRGETTTLGRGGSDFTASILGEALDAQVIELWTDVSGVMSADPRLVEDAFPLPRISYAELMELSHFGAKVVHPPSVHPARRRGIPLAIRNTLDPSAPGTLIQDDSVDNPYPVRGISSIHRVDLLRLEGDGMVGVPGIAMRLFGCLARAGVSIILISQASSEHSICWAISPDDTSAAQQAVENEFELEISLGRVDPLIIDRGQSVIAVVGEGMRERPGLAARLFGGLARVGINVRAVAQGSSELNISLVVAGEDEVVALRAIHSTFFAPTARRVRLVLLGSGKVGSELLEQTRSLIPHLLRDRDIDLRWVAIANSRRLLTDAQGIALDGWRDRLVDAPAGGPRELLDWLRTGSDQTLVVDATASDSIGDHYNAMISAGYSIVAANKKPFCRAYEEFTAWSQAARRRRSALRFEATVGAGLPVLSTLSAQLEAGDSFTRVVGVLSGSLSFLCEALRSGRRFSEAVQEADRLGYLEPNPWDDLSGEDARRKICILARVAGFALEPEDVQLEPFVEGPEWSRLEPADLWKRLPEVDEDFARRQQEAERDGLRWRYVVSFDGVEACARLRAVGPQHPCFDTIGPESLFALTTRLYPDTPLVVRGPGAGPAVTASGMLVDILRILESLPGRDDAPRPAPDLQEAAS